MALNRIEAAIELLKEGKSSIVEDLLLSAENPNEIEVSGWSNYSYLENITKEIAQQELTQIKQHFTKVLNMHITLIPFIEGKSISYVLLYDDGGKASVIVCQERNGVIEWVLDRK